MLCYYFKIDLFISWIFPDYYGFNFIVTVVRLNYKFIRYAEKIILFVLIYNTLSATRNILRRRLSIVEKSSPNQLIPRRG
jgi:hypothetical protein